MRYHSYLRGISVFHSMGSGTPTSSMYGMSNGTDTHAFFVNLSQKGIGDELTMSNIDVYFTCLLCMSCVGSCACHLIVLQ